MEPPPSTETLQGDAWPITCLPRQPCQDSLLLGQSKKAKVSFRLPLTYRRAVEKGSMFP